jgi:hypothetical protein
MTPWACSLRDNASTPDLQDAVPAACVHTSSPSSSASHQRFGLPTVAPAIMTMTKNNVTSHQDTSSSGSSSIDVLASVFFVVASCWLVMAVLYAGLVLVFLRLRARGELERMYEPDFGRLYLWRTNLYIPWGWLIRRYVRHVQPQSAVPIPIQCMTRLERRQAMEVLLRNNNNISDKGKGGNANEQMDLQGSPSRIQTQETAVTMSDESSAVSFTNNDARECNSVTGLADTSFEGPVCSICLGCYEDNDNVLLSKTCPHKFHKECILDWLQRHANAECPCCRVAMTSEAEVWKTVQSLRKQQNQPKRNVWRFRTRPATASHVNESSIASEVSLRSETSVIHVGDDHHNVNDSLSDNLGADEPVTVREEIATISDLEANIPAPEGVRSISSFEFEAGGVRSLRQSNNGMAVTASDVEM